MSSSTHIRTLALAIVSTLTMACSAAPSPGAGRDGELVDVNGRPADGTSATGGGAAPGAGVGEAAAARDGGADGDAAREGTRSPVDASSDGVDAGAAAPTLTPAALLGHWACPQVSANGGVTFSDVVVGNATTPGTHARNFVFAADGTFHNLSNAPTGSNFWWWHDVLSVTQIGSTFIVATRAKAQASCNHGISGPLAWPGQNGASDSWGAWGDGRALLSSSFTYRVELLDATHAHVHVGYPSYAFYSASGASTVGGAGTGALVFKCDKVSRDAWRARVRIPTGGPGAPGVCTNPP